MGGELKTEEERQGLLPSDRGEGTAVTSSQGQHTPGAQSQPESFLHTPMSTSCMHSTASSIFSLLHVCVRVCVCAHVCVSQAPFQSPVLGSHRLPAWMGLALLQPLQTLTGSKAAPSTSTSKARGRRLWGRAPHGHQRNTWSQCLFSPCEIFHCLPFYHPFLQLMKEKQPEGWGGRGVLRVSASATLGGQQSQDLSGMNIRVIWAAPLRAGAPPWPAIHFGPLCREAGAWGLCLPGCQQGL